MGEKQPFTYRAGADLADALAVTRGSGARDVLPTEAGTDEQVGVVDEGGGVGSGQAIRIVKYGRAFARAGDAISLHARVTGGVGGKIVEATTGDYVLGRSEQEAAEEDDLIVIFVEPSQVVI